MAVNIIPVLLLLYFIASSSAMSAPKVPCFFIFGDALVDNGNNNQLTTSAKANYVPYGIDFPQGPTGRFTNGPNVADILAELLGFDTYIPPFTTAQGEEIINGVNYASGPAGIRSETGQQLGDRMSLDQQLINHKLTVSRIAHFLGNITSAQNHIGRCLYYLTVGNNDYRNKYFLPHYYNTSSSYTTPQEYATILIQQYSNQLKILYSLGARKVCVSGLGALGCDPPVLHLNQSACDESINNAVGLFNDNLKLLINDLNNNLADAQFVFTSALLLRPSDMIALGVRFVSEPCCKVSKTTGLCIPGETPCPVRPLYAFYDNFHPTQNVNQFIGKAAYNDMLKLIS